MTSRERINIALNHEEPDRIPIDLGGTVVTSIALSTYEKLRSHLGLSRGQVQTFEIVQQIAAVDDDVRDIFGIDTIPVFSNPPKSGGPLFVHAPNGTVSFKDEFGATLKKPSGSYYFDWQEFPLAEPSAEALNAMPWPDAADPARYKGLRERVKHLRETTSRALVGMAPCGHDLFNQIFRVRGMENGLVDLIANEDFAEMFFERLAATICAAQSLFLDAVGDLIDVHFTADDLAGQNGPLVSPALYRRMIKPHWAKIIAVIKSKTKAKILYHSCGAIDEFIPDLIDIGVDIINPVQVSAAGMDSTRLKKKYGRRLSFWGGASDTQKVLPHGSIQEVRSETRRRIGELARGGGFVFNPVHNIQPLVPPENIIALFNTAREYGKYPIQI